MYTNQDSILFILALVLFMLGLALIDLLIKLQESWALKQNKRKLQSLNRYEDLRRRHKSFLAGMSRVLAELQNVEEKSRKA